jgi:hypothetical protein
MLLTFEPIGVNCLDPGARVDIGLDNGDGGATAGDGVLQASEIDDSEFICTPTPPELVNASFETGNFTGWVTQDSAGPFRQLAVTDAPASAGSFGTVNGAASDGSFGVVTGFDGSAAQIFVAQDVDLTKFSTASVSFDWSVPFCNLTFGATINRTFSLVVEPSGGGTALFSQVLFTCLAGTTTSQSLVNDQVVDISSAAGQPVRIKFNWNVPQNSTGPAEAHLDDVAIVVP